MKKLTTIKHQQLTQSNKRTKNTLMCNIWCLQEIIFFKFICRQWRGMLNVCIWLCSRHAQSLFYAFRITSFKISSVPKKGCLHFHIPWWLHCKFRNKTFWVEDKTLKKFVHKISYRVECKNWGQVRNKIFNWSTLLVS